MRVVDLCVKDVNELARMAFSGLMPLVIEDVADEGERIVVKAGRSRFTLSCRRIESL